MSSKLRSIRAGHRNVISRLLKKFEDIRDDGDESVNTEELTKIVNNLLKKQETLQKLNQEILENLDEGEVEAEIVDSDEYAYTLDGKITQIQKLILVNTSELNTNAKDFVSYSGPSHSAPAQPAHDQQSYAQSAHDQQSYAQPVHDQQSYAQPGRYTKQNTCNSNFREPETQFSRSNTRINEYNKLPKLNLPTLMPNINREKDRLCFNFLGHHNLSACKSTKTCNKCHKRHHTSICKDNVKTNEDNKPTGDVSVGTIQHNAEEPDIVLHSQSPDRVLLKTAINPVSAEHEILDAKILFDEGAQRSFITEELAEKLKLKHTGTESVNLSGFGDNANSTKIRHLRTGLVYLITTDGKLPIRVLIVPEIAAPMRTYVRQAAKLTYLLGIKLAHPVTADENFEISILIGADYFWSIVQNDIIRGEGPTAVQSKIGYLLSGTLHSHNSDTDGYKRASMMNVMIATNTDEYDLEKFWKIESLATEKIDTTKLEEQIDIQKT
ncbi:uncharacterized protein [Mytilus edulis]|uniref:uncharacterized protein n=1 Tax=Mytilus edulis TaxID=6550 RepID=UPI0039EFA72E